LHFCPKPSLDKPLRDNDGARLARSRKGRYYRRAGFGEMYPSEDQLRKMIDTIPALAWSCLPDGANEFTNKRWRDYTGLSQAEALGSGWQRTFHPDDLGKVMENWRAVQASGEPSGAEARVRRADGEYRWMLHQKVAVRDESGHIVKWYGTSIDIEDRRQAEQKLRQVLEEIRGSEANLRRTLDTIPALVSSFSPEGSNECMNQRWHDYTGLSPEQSQGDGWQEPVHPDDLAPLMNRWREARMSGEPGETEARLRRHDGVYRWFFVRAEPLRDESGKVVKWYVTSTDIEDRKKAEGKLRQDECELRRITDAIPQTIIVQDADGIPIYANKALLDYAGLTIEDVSRPDFRALIAHPEDFERQRDIRPAALLSGLPFEIEVRGRSKDGQYRWFLARYNPFRDEQGRLVRWYVTGTDIEDRKRAEDRTKNENVALREEVDKASMFEEIVGTSSTLQAVLTLVAKVAPTESTIIISGETGTGKELIARAIHKRSPRSARAFVSVNCAAIPQSLIASELFGHEKGAFTGALQRRLGRFEMAEGGTLFLDEIGELPCETQIALLRVLQERQFERVGASQPIRADVRVISATNRDLRSAMATGAFRSDLFYRLSVFPIEIPPLRERKDDISMLVEYFIDRYARAAGKNIRNISKKSMELLQSYPWPGNVRELQNVIERSVILCEGETFSVDENWLSRETPQAGSSTQPLVQALATQQRTMIEAALAEAGGQVSGAFGAAARLGMRPSTLESKIRSLKIDKHRFKTPEEVTSGSVPSQSTRRGMPGSSRA
jgi:formate hydrogenlyase transcriptional activator